MNQQRRTRVLGTYQQARGIAARMAACALLALLSPWAAAASLTWDWRFSLVGANPSQPVLSGTFTTGDTPDADGFYEITALTGNRLGVAIVSLQPTGTAIPDNMPYPVDNRIRPLHPDGQMTKARFGYGLANGWFENPFLATWELPGLVYYAFLSKPPFGTQTPQTEEPQVIFEASIRVPEPLSAGLLLSGLLALGWVQSVGRSPSNARLRGRVRSAPLIPPAPWTRRRTLQQPPWRTTPGRSDARRPGRRH